MNLFQTAVSCLLVIIHCNNVLAQGVTAEVTEQDILNVLINDISVRQYGRVEILSQQNIELQANYISLHLLNKQKLLNNGSRSEVSVDFPFTEHETITY